MSGFVVVRKPSHCRQYSDLPLAVQNGEKIYHGVDRCAWEEYAWGDQRFELNLYRDTVLGPCGVNIISDRELVEVVAIEGVHDVLWVSSHPDASRKANLLGVDLMTDRGSALAQGIFKLPDLFADFIPGLNGFGLFPDLPEVIQAYCARYLGLQESVSELETFDSLGLENAIFVYSDIGPSPRSAP